MQRLQSIVRIAYTLAVLIASLVLSDIAAAQRPHLSTEQARNLGARIWRNESGGTVEGLTAWNDGEEFASLGIGHFIWYPAGAVKRFDEQFPALLNFFAHRGVVLPDWLQGPGPSCPWPTRAAFMRELHTPRMRALRDLLQRTVVLQTSFIVDRLARSMTIIKTQVPSSQHATLQRRFDELAASNQGLYALIDYVNFKGEGIAPGERYQGEGWGLLQVLQGMRESTQQNLLEDFAASAQRVLERRVMLSPPQRKEQRWLAGWRKRIQTYTHAR